MLIIINPNEKELNNIKKSTDEEIIAFYSSLPDNIKEKVVFDKNFTKIHSDCDLEITITENKGKSFEFCENKIKISNNDNIKEYNISDLNNIKILKIGEDKIHEYSSFNDFLDKYCQNK